MRVQFRFCLILIFTWLPAAAWGQVIISTLNLPSGKVSIDNVLSVQINNTQPNSVYGFLKISYHQNNKPQAEITYQQIELPQGVKVINTGDLARKEEIISDENLKRHRQLPAGQVMLCIDFINVEDISLGNICNTIYVTDNNDSTSAKLKRKIPIEFSGYAEISGNYSNRQGSFQQLPANYTHIIFNPRLDVFGLPIGARFNYSTASDPAQQNMNLFTVYLDATKLREKLDKKYITNVAKEYLLEKTELTDYKTKKAELEKVTTILNNPHIKNELSKLNQLDSLNKLIQDSASYLTPDRVKDLRSQKDSLDYLEEKRDAYGSLLNKHKSLSQILSIYDDSTETPLLKDSLDKLSNIIENTRDPFTADDEKKLQELDSLLGDENSKISKQRREITKKQRDALYEKKKAKEKHEALKEKYATLYHTYQYKSKMDSLKNLRNGAKGFSKDSLANILNNKDKLKDRLAFLRSVKNLNIGFFAPFSGELTLNGVPIRGLGIDLEFKKFFVSVAGGKLQRQTAFIERNSSPSPYSRNLYSVTLGVGKSTGNYFCVQYIDAKDKVENIISADSSVDFFNSRAGYSQVIASRFKTSFFKNKTTLEGEIAGSQLTNTTTIITEVAGNKHSPVSWMENIFNSNSGPGFRTGYAYKLAATQKFNKGLTVLNLSSKKVMPGFLSFGNPYLIADIFTNEAKLSQQLWKGKVTVSGLYRINSDNLAGIKTFTTRAENFGGDFTMRIPKWPTLRVSYLPMVIQTPGNYFNTNMLMANSVYAFRRKDFYHMASAIYINQTSKSSGGYSNFRSSNYTLSYMLSYKQYLSLNLTGNYIEQLSYVKLKGLIGNIAVGYTLLKKHTFTAGTLIAENSTGARNTYYGEITSTVLKGTQLRIRFDKTAYLSSGVITEDDSYQENLLIFSIVKQW